jgi:hypothetical protein
MYTYSYRYFAKTINRSSRFADLCFLRVPHSDPRIPTLEEQYNKIGISYTLSFPFPPTKEQEVFELKMRMRSWDMDATVARIDEKGWEKLC